MTLRQAAILAALTLTARAQEIRIDYGITDYQVLQRTAEQTADLAFGGTAANKKSNNKVVQARLTSGDKVVSSFDWAAIDKVKKQRWGGRLKGVPAGGPYRLEVRLPGGGAAFAVDHILVGDLWVLAGQSNMEGHGELVDAQPPTPLVHSFDMSDRWLVAEEPLHTLVSAADRVHWRANENNEPEAWTGEKLERYLHERKKGAGLGLRFAEEMVRRTGVPVGLIPCAHSGTTMDQWSPALKDREGDSLYGSMFRRFRAVGGNVKGVLWYQGESDANPKNAPGFKRNFEEFVSAVRKDFNEPGLPFYYVQIGRHVDNKNVAEWNQVQAAQLKAEKELENVGMVASIDCTLDDPIHISTEGLKRLGQRLAEVASHDLFPAINSGFKTGPRPASAIYENGIVKVNFSGVNGGLEAVGRVSGFTIHDDKAELVPLIYRTAIDSGDASRVLLYVGGKLPPGATLWYGFGKDPYCNLRDAKDMAAPVFGAFPIQRRGETAW